jgi:hypothetical protein
MVLLRQAERALGESYRLAIWKAKFTLCAVLRLWIAYGSCLLFWLLSAGASRSAAQLLTTPSMDVVVRGDAPGVAVLGEQLAAVPGVGAVRYRLNADVVSSALSGPVPGVVPSFSVQTRIHHPDTLAVVASRIRRIEDVIDVIYSVERMKRTSDLLAWLRLTTDGLGIVVVGLVLLVMTWHIHTARAERAVMTRVMLRLGASRMFIAAPAAVLGGVNGFVAAGLALLFVMRAYRALAGPLVIAETMMAFQCVLFLIGGALVGSLADFITMLLVPPGDHRSAFRHCGWG